MFEDLDDPTPPRGDRAARDAVTQRVARRRASQRARQRTVLLGTLAVLVVAAAVTGLAVANRDRDVVPAGDGTTSTTTSAPVTTAASDTTSFLTATTSSLPSPTTTAGFAPFVAVVYDVDFVSSTDGWAIGTSDITGDCGSCGVMLRTGDGGLSWSATPGAPRGSRIRVGGDGTVYVFGGVFAVSRDGGATWEDESLPASGDFVTALEPEGADVLAATCTGTSACVLSHSTDAGATWTLVDTPAMTDTGNVDLVRERAGTWMLTSREGRAPALWYAEDSVTWTALGVPCDADHSFGADLAVVDPQHLWAACRGDAATGHQGKQVARSNDGGETWTTVADPGLPGLLLGIAAADADRVFLAMDRGTLLGSDDGGATWHEAIPRPDGGDPLNETVAPVRFVDPRHGWAVRLHPPDAPVLWRTTDGGATWSPHPIH